LRLLDRLKIRQKLALVLALSGMSVVAAIALGALFLHQKMVADREEQTREVSAVVLGMVKFWYGEGTSGHMTRAEAQKAAVAALRPLRFGHDGYLWINRYDGLTILHAAHPEFEGHNRREVVDPDGVPNVQRAIAAAQNGGGFVHYRFTRPGGTEAVAKISYNVGFDPWQWAIGTGVYVDDIESEFRASVLRLGLIAAAIFAAAAVSALLVNRNVSASLGRLKSKMERLATGDLSVGIDEAQRADEIGDMGRAMVVFKDNAVAARQLEEEREKRRELETLVSHAGKVEAIGHLAGGIAHDLNNALVPVLAMTKMAMSRLPKDSRAYANLDLAMLGANRAKGLVEQILTFSRKEEIKMRDFDPAPVIADGVRLLRASLPTPIRLVSKIDPAPAIHGDPGQLYQILVNLVANSAYAIGDRPGLITVTLLVPSPSEVRLSVSDTGCGMDEATKARMFEPFFTTKPVGQGTGLGMAVVRGVVLAHHGTIAVESRRGEGTRIDVSLPPAAAAEAVSVA